MADPPDDGRQYKGFRCNPCISAHKGCDGVRPICDRCSKRKDRGIDVCTWQAGTGAVRRQRQSSVAPTTTSTTPSTGAPPTTKAPTFPAATATATALTTQSNVQVNPAMNTAATAPTLPPIVMQMPPPPPAGTVPASQDPLETMDVSAPPPQPPRRPNNQRPPRQSTRPPTSSNAGQAPPANRQSPPWNANDPEDRLSFQELAVNPEDPTPTLPPNFPGARRMGMDGSGENAASASGIQQRNYPGQQVFSRQRLTNDGRRNAFSAQSQHGPPDQRRPTAAQSEGVTPALVLSGNLPSVGIVTSNVDRGLAEYVNQRTTHLTVAPTDARWNSRQPRVRVTGAGQFLMTWEYPYRPGRPSTPMTAAEAAPYLGGAPEVDPEVFRVQADPPAQASDGGVHNQAAANTTSGPATSGAGNEGQQGQNNGQAAVEEAEDDSVMDQFVDWDGKQ